MISGVMPVHNEARYLSYSLPMLSMGNLDEMVFVLDRCQDQSEAWIDWFATSYPWIEVLKIHVSERRYKWPTAEVFRIGYEAAQGDIIYSLGADCIYNPKIFYVPWGNLDIASFPYTDFPLFNDNVRNRLIVEWVNVYRVFRLALAPIKFWGIFGFKKKLLEYLPFEDVLSEDMAYLRQAVKLGFKYRVFNEWKSLHLRPVFGNSDKEYLHGKARAQLGQPLWKVAAHSALLFKPRTLKGYLVGKHEA